MLILASFESAAILQNAVTADIRRHDDDGVLKVHRAALAIGQPTVVQHLQHDVEHIVVCLLDFVEQDHRVRPPPHGFGKLAAFFITHVARRRADQPRYRMLFLIFRHVDADHGPLVIEKELCQRPRQLGFADARRSQENEAADWPVGIFEAAARTNHRFTENLGPVDSFGRNSR